MIVLAPEFIAKKRLQARQSFILASACAAAAVVLKLSTFPAQDALLDFTLAFLSIASGISSLLFLGYATVVHRKFSPITEGPLSATLTLARRHNTEVDRTLYVVERQGRALTRNEAIRLLQEQGLR